MRKVFLDGASNTPLDKKVFKAMKPYLNRFVGNASSTHDFGVIASQAVIKAKQSMCRILGVQDEEFYITSGATESNNWVVMSLAFHELEKPQTERRTKIVVSAIEHDSVLETCKKLRDYGFTVFIIPVDSNGFIDTTKLDTYIDSNTLLVCVMAVNNELGTEDVPSLRLIGDFAHRKGALVLSDITQFMSMFLSLDYYPSPKNIPTLDSLFPTVDYLTFSAHKFYGPLGVGGMIAKNKAPIYPFIYGREQGGKRGGTLSVPLIVGMAKAMEVERTEKSMSHIINIADYFHRCLEDFVNKYKVNFPKMFYGLANIENLCFAQDLNSDNLADDFACRGIAVSAGSACNATHNETEGDFNPSHVLVAIGRTEKEIRNTVRVSFTKYTTKKDIRCFFDALKDIYEEQGYIMKGDHKWLLK